MSRTISWMRAGLAAVVLALGAGSVKAQTSTDPFTTFRYEPWAVYASYQALLTGQTVVSTENSSYTAQNAYNYSALTWQYMQYIYYNLYPIYVTGGTSSQNYTQFVTQAQSIATQANQAVYQAYLENPTNNSQAFSGWQWYTWSYANGMASQGVPQQNTSASASVVAGYYVLARLYGSDYNFNVNHLNHDANLDIAAQHHAEYMAAHDAVSNDENGVTTNAIIMTNSQYQLDVSVPVTVLNTQTSNVGFIGYQFASLVASVNASVTDLGVGVATSSSGKVYYSIYVAKRL